MKETNELLVQSFIRKHPDQWESILSNKPYCLSIKKKGSLIMLKYNQIKSDFNNPIVRECRGLILEDGTFNRVSYPFFKFFNIDEPFADRIDWSTAEATEKIDGSLISVYYYNGKWNVATNGNIDAHDSELNNGYANFYELFIAAAIKSNLYFENLDKNNCYVFELVSPYNTVVISYGETKLYHLMTRNVATGREIFDNIGVERPKSYKLTAESSYRELVEQLGQEATIHEGIVVKDAYGHRVKIKTQRYFELHKTANNGRVAPAYLLKLVRDNDYDEFLAYFPDYRETIESYKTDYAKMISTLEYIQTYTADYQADLLKKYSSRTAKTVFAITVKEYPFAYYYFQAWKGVNLIDKITAQIDNPTMAERLIKTFFKESN